MAQQGKSLLDDLEAWSKQDGQGSQVSDLEAWAKGEDDRGPQFEFGTIGSLRELTPPAPEPQPAPEPRASQFEFGTIGSMRELTPEPAPEPAPEPEEPSGFEKTVKAIPEVAVALPAKAFDAFLTEAVVSPLNALANWFRDVPKDAPSMFELISGGEVTPETMRAMIAKGGAAFETADDITTAAGSVAGFVTGVSGKVIAGSTKLTAAALGKTKMPQWAAGLLAASGGFAGERALMTQGDPNATLFGAVAGPFYAGIAKLGPRLAARLEVAGWNRNVARIAGGGLEGAGFAGAHETAGILGRIAGMPEEQWAQVAPLFQAAFHMGWLLPGEREEILNDPRYSDEMKRIRLEQLDAQGQMWAQQFKQGLTHYVGTAAGFAGLHAARGGQSGLMPKEVVGEKPAAGEGEPIQRLWKRARRLGIENPEERSRSQLENAIAKAEAKAQARKATPPLPPSQEQERKKVKLGSPEPESPSSSKRPLSSTAQTSNKTSVQEIVKHLESITGAPQRVGKFRQKAAGIYKVHDHVARRKDWGSLETAYHEFGHSLQGKLFGFPAKWPNAKIRQELMARGKDLYGAKKPKGGYKAEGFAEVIAREILGEDPATFAPETAKWLADVRAKDPALDAGLKKAKQQFETWQKMGDVERWRSHIVSSEKPKLSLTERMQKFRKRHVNDASPLEDLEASMLKAAGIDPKTWPADKSPSVTRAALKMNAMGTARNVIEVGMVDTKGNVTGPSLREVLEPVWKNADDFAAYVTAKRGVSLVDIAAKTGKGKQGDQITGYSREAMQNVVDTLETPEFLNAAKRLTEWHNSLLDYVIDSGGLSKENGDAIRKANPFYVPFFRALEGREAGGMGAKGEVNQPEAVKRRRGSVRPIRDPFETLVETAQHMIHAGNKAQVARALIEFGEAVPGAGKMIEKVDLPPRAQHVRLRDVKKQLEDQGIDLDGANLDQFLTAFSAANMPQGRENVVAVWRNGKREFYQLDPELYSVVTGVDKVELKQFWDTFFGKALTTAAKVKRASTTGVNPAFATKNVIRDAWAASIHTKSDKLVDKIPGVLTLKGAAMKLLGAPEVARFKALGGELGSMMGRDRFESKKQLDSVMADAKRMKALNVFRNPLEMLQAWNGWFENAPRVAEFKEVLKQAEAKHGKNSRAAVLEALLAGKDITLNFTRQGTVGGLMNQMIPFWNARMQGPSKFYRTMKERPVQFAAQSFLSVTVPAIVLWWLNKDKEWYQARPEWERKRFLMMSPDGEGKDIYRLPLVQDHDYIAAALPVAALQSMYEKDPEAVTEQLWDTFQNLLPAQHLLDLAPALIKPGAEVSTNYQTFQDRPIVPQWMEDTQLPKNRYNDWTTETSKQIGKLLGVAPLKVEHFIKEHTGGLVINTLRHVENMAGWRTDERIKGPWDTPIVGTLRARPGMNDQFVADFYDRKELLTQRKGSEEASPLEAAELKHLDAIARSMKEIRDSNLKPEVKLQRIRRLAQRGLAIQQK